MNIRGAANSCDKLYAFIKSLETSESTFYKSSKTLLLHMRSRFGEMADSISYTLDNSTVESKYDLCSEDAVDAIKELEEYIDDIVQGHKHMYRSSTDNLKQVNECCKRISEKISYLLGEANQPNKLESDILDIKEMLSSIIQSNSSASDVEKLPTVSKTSSSQVPEIQEDLSVSEQESKVPRTSKKKYMKLYRDAFGQIDENLSDIYMADRCASIIAEWFQVRFGKADLSFHYDISNIPKYLLAVVLNFGKSIRDGTSSEYIRNFNKWLQEVEDSGSKYALPYEVYTAISDPSPEDVTLQGLVLWDVLLDTSLKPLLDMPPGYISVSQTDMIDWATTWRPDILDEYKNYKEDPNLLQICGLVRIFDSTGKEE